MADHCRSTTIKTLTNFSPEAPNIAASGFLFSNPCCGFLDSGRTPQTRQEPLRRLGEHLVARSTLHQPHPVFSALEQASTLLDVHSYPQRELDRFAISINTFNAVFLSRRRVDQIGFCSDVLPLEQRRNNLSRFSQARPVALTKRANNPAL